VQRLDVGEDVVAGHFPQVVVAVRPFQQGRADSVEVEQTVPCRRGRLRGPPSCRTRVQRSASERMPGASPSQPLGEPAPEGGFAVVLEDPHVLQDRESVADPQVPGPQRGEGLRVPDDVAPDVAGEDKGQVAVDGETDAASPATGLGELVGELQESRSYVTGQQSTRRRKNALATGSASQRASGNSRNVAHSRTTIWLRDLDPAGVATSPQGWGPRHTTSQPPWYPPWSPPARTGPTTRQEPGSPNNRPCKRR